MPVALRRLTALFAGVMMLVLVLAESGFACAMPDMAASAQPGAVATATADVAGMDDMNGMTRERGPSGTAPASDGEPAPCRFPWAPSGCRDMAPCAPAALTAAAWQPEGSVSVREARRDAPVLAPPSFATPPEPPPPRA